MIPLDSLTISYLMFDDYLPSLTIGYFIFDDSLPWTENRNPSLKINKFRDSLTWQLKSYQMSISCFLIGMKFISKILKNCLRESSSFPDPLFGVPTFQNVKNRISKFPAFKLLNYKSSFFFNQNINSQTSRFPNISKFSQLQVPQNQKVRYIHVPTFSNFQILRHENNIYIYIYIY